MIGFIVGFAVGVVATVVYALWRLSGLLDWAGMDGEGEPKQ